MQIYEICSNAHLIYFAAHGLGGDILFGPKGISKISYAELGAALRAGLNKSEDVTVIFGMCEALKDKKLVLPHLPHQVTEVYGFIGKPKSKDVADLLAGILVDDMRLLKNLIDDNTAAFGAGVKADDLSNATAQLVQRFNNTLDAHDPEPEHFVDGTEGKFVRHYSRQGMTGQWQLMEGLSVPGRRHAEPVSSAVTG